VSPGGWKNQAGSGVELLPGFNGHGLLFQILRYSSVVNVHSLPPRALNLKKILVDFA